MSSAYDTDKYTIVQDTYRGSHQVVLYNDDHTPMDYVSHIIQYACKVDPITAQNIMLIAHNKGRASAFAGDYLECVKVRDIFGEARLESEIQEIE